MPEFSAALFDFAIFAHADVELDVIGEQIAEVQEKFAEFKPAVELYGNASNGELVVFWRFPFAAYSTALRQKMEKQSQRLKGRLLETQLLSADDRQRFYGERLPSFEVKVDATEKLKDAIAVFREKMGLSPGSAVYQLAFGSAEDVASAYARCVAQGALFVPTRKVPDEGAEVTLLFSAPGEPPMEAKGQVLEVKTEPATGFDASIVPGEALTRFVSKRAAAAHAGKLLRPGGGRRVHPRFEACLDVEFSDYPTLSGEFASNISRGGMFIRTEKPVPARSKVRLRVKLPDKTTAETEAEVVHVVTPEDAKAHGGLPGLGVSFSAQDRSFLEQFERCLESLPRRKPHVLVVDDDAFFRRILGDALTAAGMEVEVAGNGEEAMEKLTQTLFELDLMVLDLNIPGIDGYCLLDRIRRLGGELDLKIVVVSGSSEEELAQVVGRGGANDAIGKGTSLEDVVNRLQRAIGLEPGAP